MTFPIPTLCQKPKGRFAVENDMRGVHAVPPRRKARIISLKTRHQAQPTAGADKRAQAGKFGMRVVKMLDRFGAGYKIVS